MSKRANPLDGFELRCAFPPEQPGQRAVQPCDLGMGEAAKNSANGFH
jgi:hypothetical protein